MKQRKEVESNNLSIRVCSWNVAECNPATLSTSHLKKWMGFTEEEGCPEVLAIGLQEADMSLWALFKHKKGTRKSTAWHTLLKKIFDEFDMDVVEVKYLMGLVSLLVTHKEISPKLIQLESVIVPTGWFGFCGNKGAISIRVQLNNMNYCFVNSHLTPHTGKVASRNKQFHKINDKTQFINSPKGIYGHDCVFWFGDLNYRLDYPKGEVMKVLYASGSSVARLLERDQLLKVISSGQAFRSFKEMAIDWHPTYKFKKSTDVYSSKRAPSYCDRVLWYEREFFGVSEPQKAHAKVVCKGYNSVVEFTQSDHKPVYATFDSHDPKPEVNA